MGDASGGTSDGRLDQRDRIQEWVGIARWRSSDREDAHERPPVHTRTLASAGGDVGSSIAWRGTQAGAAEGRSSTDSVHRDRLGFGSESGAERAAADLG